MNPEIDAGYSGGSDGAGVASIDTRIFGLEEIWSNIEYSRWRGSKTFCHVDDSCY